MVSLESVVGGKEVISVGCGVGGEAREKRGGSFVLVDLRSDWRTSTSSVTRGGGGVCHRSITLHVSISVCTPYQITILR